MRKTFTQLTCLITALISCIHLFTCHIHLCQHPPHSVASARANYCISGNLSSPSPMGQILQEGKWPGLSSPPSDPAGGPSMAEVRSRTSPVHKATTGQRRWWKLPDSKQRATVTLKPCALHNPRACCPSPFLHTHTPRLNSSSSRLITLCHS